MSKSQPQDTEPSSSPTIRLKSLSFDRPPFRKLGSLEIPLADRITIIAGHNGIGKSTILALLANGSGLTGKEHTSYFNRTYQANLNDIIHIDFAGEWEGIALGDLPMPTVTYEIDGETLKKRCAMTGRRDRQEVRVVPRSLPHRPFRSNSSGVEVGSDSKVPWPTLYLGMTRMLPIGESDPTWIKTTEDATIDPGDAKFIRAFINSVINLGSAPKDSKIVTQAISGTPKIGKHPTYFHSPRTISLGQDSLSSIATALASFRKLKREWPAYPGGLLVIDEMDAGFHPHAQRKLLTQLRSSARELDLQVVATTHSMIMIESVHPDLQPVAARTARPDSIVYLADTSHPALLADQAIESIRRDMNLDPVPGATRSVTPEVKVYLEDPEAYFFLMRILTSRYRLRVKKEVGVRISPVPLSAGCDNLKGFVSKDPYFKTVAIVLDADSNIGRNSANNICRLPGGVNRQGGNMNPEGTLFHFLVDIVEGREVDAQVDLAGRNITTDQIREHLIGENVSVGDRIAAKSWFNKCKSFLKDWKIVELWAERYPKAVAQFEDDLVVCLGAARTARLRYVF